jgi:tRNA-specific 2-thiouridylase
VRAVARDLGLATADKPESQEVCFVPGGDYRDALRDRAGWEEQPGPLVDRDGTQVGTHRGAPAYTVGQRSGLGVALGEPRYVARIDPGTNLIQLGRRGDLETRRIVLDDVRFVAGSPPPADRADGSFSGAIRIRHRAPLVEARVRPLTDETSAAGRGSAWLVETREAVWAAAPGQAGVLYDGDTCLGGGRIARGATDGASSSSSTASRMADAQAPVLSVLG